MSIGAQWGHSLNQEGSGLILGPIFYARLDLKLQDSPLYHREYSEYKATDLLNGSLIEKYQEEITQSLANHVFLFGNIRFL